MRKDIEYLSEGNVLRGWLYRPDQKANTYPTIVMAHGFSAVKEQHLDKYADVFAAAGFVVILYDHANFSASDGPVRQEVDPVLQRRGYRDAITFAQTLPEVDADRIGLWGTSFSGGHVI
nr:CocE/NonD family hydrolase [Pseudomonas chlororaphis]